jgi:uncharacterized membrane protein
VATVTDGPPLGKAPAMADVRRPDRPATPPRPARTSGRTWPLIVALLVPAVVVPLLVPLYDSEEPTLAGWPFYFWFQMAMIPLAVVLTVAAYYLARRADRHAREARAHAGDGERGGGR